MTPIEIVAVDERDSGWERHDPRFRVYLQGGSMHAGREWTGGTTATFDVTGADLLQVIDWAERTAAGRSTYAIALVVDEADGGRGLVWLVGLDGNDLSPEEPAWVDAQRRMLARRQHPVVVGDADRMPDS